MKTNRYIHVFFSAIVLLTIVSLSSCKKEKDTISSENSGAKLVFNVSNEIGSVENKKLASVKQFGSQSMTSFSQGDKFSMITHSEESEVRELQINKDNKIAKKIASSYSEVHDYTRYRIILFNVTTNQIEKNVETEAGSNLELSVTTGNQYKWYAYSYNNSGRIDLPEVENGVPMVRTQGNKNFLWASSGATPITATSDPMPISIIFEHRMAEFVLEIDINGLYGKIKDLHINLDRSHLQNAHYFNTAKINIFTGVASNIEDYPISELSLDDFDISSDSTIIRVVFYTANPTGILNNVKAHIRKVTIQHDNNHVVNLHKLTDVAKSIQFSFTDPHVSKSHVAKVKLRYLIPKKKILHVIEEDVISGNDDDESWSFAAQLRNRSILSWTNVDLTNSKTPPLNMLKEPLNFGPLSNSIVHTDGFSHERAKAGQLAQKLSTASSIPDIVIMSVYYSLTSSDINALITYLNNGGIVLMMTDAVLKEKNLRDELDPVRDFMRTFFNNSSIDYSYQRVYTASNNSDPLLFEMDPEGVIRDRIINGPFGSLSRKYWGLDNGPVVRLLNLPIGDGADQVTVYSNGQPVNAGSQSQGTTMFKHNSKGLFWIGDGSFLAHDKNKSNGWSTNWYNEPFATVGVGQSNPESGPSHTHYPVSKVYGSDYNNATLGNVGHTYGARVYNSTLFANVIAWAGYYAEFFGINTENLIPGSVKDWNVSGGSVNYNYNQ